MKKLSWFWDCVCCSFAKSLKSWEDRGGYLRLGVIVTERYQNPIFTLAGISTMNRVLIDKVVFGSPYTPIVQLLPFLVAISSFLELGREVYISFAEKLEDLEHRMEPWSIYIYNPEQLLKDACEEITEDTIVEDIPVDTSDCPMLEDLISEGIWSILDDIKFKEHLKLYYRPSPTKHAIIRYLRSCAFDSESFLEFLAELMVELVIDDISNMGSALYGRYVEVTKPEYL